MVEEFVCSPVQHDNLNLYVLFCKYGNNKMSHDDFREELIQKLIDEGMKTSIF